MDPSEIDELVHRLVANPHDEDALAYAHQAGAADPKAYAFLLEKVGTETRDPGYASHWLSEAANVWSTTLGDAHRAARVLMMAIDKDPTQNVAAERLAQLYRDKGDVRALVALLERRAKALAPHAHQNPEMRGELAGMHEELGRLWTDPPLSQPKKAIESYKRAIELDPSSAYAIYNARELLKAAGQYDEAIVLYETELRIEQDAGRRLALLSDEAATRKLAGDLQGVSRALATAREIDDQDPALSQEYAASVLERIQAGEGVPPGEKSHAAELLVALAETYDGEHGLAYAGAALDIDPGLDRGMQLFAYYARTLEREEDLPHRLHAYVQLNPNGAMAAEAHQALAAGSFPPNNGPGGPRPVNETQPSPSASGQSAASYNPGSEGSFRRGSQAPSGQLTPDKLQGILDAAQMLAGKGKKPEALLKYKEVLEADAAHPEALSWVEDYLRSKRDYAQLRDVLLDSVRLVGSDPRSMKETMETRKERLREVAGLCEGNLRDIDGAVNAWKQLLAIDRSDESARTSLTRLLEKNQRWDDLANLLEQEATAESDVDSKIALEKRLATLQEQKRKDPAGAAEAWARIAHLTPEDDRPTATAAKLFEKAGQLDKAAQIISDNAAHVDDSTARGTLLERLGELREQLNDGAGACEAYADAADVLKSAKLWESAERCAASVERWDRAANAAGQRGLLTSDPKGQAQHFARAADLLMRAGDEDAAIARYEQATDLDPFTDEYADALQDRYTSQAKWDSLVAYLAKRGDRVTDKAKRVAIRTQAAMLYATQLQDKDASREQWLKVLEDGDDREALEKLIDYAVEREDHTEAVTLLRRLGANAVDKADKARIALREAELHAEGVGDVDTAINRYEQILVDLDPTCRPALQAIADLQEARDQPAQAADALERELKLVPDPQERGQIAARLARLYEQLDDPRNAIRALDMVRKADLEDFDALARLCELCEKVEQWDRVAELLAQRIEVEGDEAEASQMTMKLAGILVDKLDRGDEALAALTEFADQGDQKVRTAYVELGDRLGWKGIVASKLVDWWFEAKHGAERTGALRGAFDRFEAVGRDQDAARVALEIVRSKGADRELAERLEGLAVKTTDHDALTIAHDLLTREVQGPDRAVELVRQAEVRVKGGMPRTEALQHGEMGLTSIPANEAEPLLERLAALAAKPGDVIDLYERQVSRSKAPADRVKALARVAQVAALRGQMDRARGFFELALTGSPTDDTLATLEALARDGDASIGSEKLRRLLCSAMAAGGQGARDGGRTRGSLLRRAASMAHRDLNDVDQAFAWLGDALVAHVDTMTLDALEGLGLEVTDPRRTEVALTHALSDVFDGPLVRQLLARRAKIRREQLVDLQGAAADLKKLHDLSPNEQAVMDELSAMLTELGDYRGMVQLYEDQILRGKDMNARAELARKVARMWEEHLQDPREAADAWRRVLRMKSNDPEGTAGLERAKSNMLKKPEPTANANAPGNAAAEDLAPPSSKEPSTHDGLSTPPPPSRGPASRGPASRGPASSSRGPASLPPPLPPSARVPPSREMVPESEAPETRQPHSETPAPGSVAPRSEPSYPTSETVETELAAVSSPEPLTSPGAAQASALVAHGKHDEQDLAQDVEDDVEEPIEETNQEDMHDLTSPHLGDVAISTADPPSDELERTISQNSTSKPGRPRDMWFRSSPDEVTMSAFSVPGLLSHSSVGGSAPTTVRGDAQEPASIDALAMAQASELHEDFVTNPAIPSMALTARGGPGSLDLPKGELEVDVDEEDLAATGEASAASSNMTALDYLDATLARPQRAEERDINITSHGEQPEGDEEEVLIADDLAEMIDVVEEEDEPKTEVTATESVTRPPTGR